MFSDETEWTRMFNKEKVRKKRYLVNEPITFGIKGPFGQTNNLI